LEHNIPDHRRGQVRVAGCFRPINDLPQGLRGIRRNPHEFSFVGAVRGHQSLTKAVRYNINEFLDDVRTLRLDGHPIAVGTP
jgi:hypothetical protein